MKDGEQWSNWAKTASFVCEGKPISFYSWGYKVEVKAKDIAGNESRYPVRYSLVWYDRAPWMLYTLVGVVLAIILIILFVMIGAMRERARARKRLAQRKAEAEKSRQDSPAAKPATGSTFDLFGTPGDSTAQGVSSFDSGFEDPFATTATKDSDQSAMDPFASSTSFSSSNLDFDSPFGKESSDPFASSQTPFDEPGGSSTGFPASSSDKPGGEKEWTDDGKIDLTDQDLFGPI